MTKQMNISLRECLLFLMLCLTFTNGQVTFLDSQPLQSVLRSARTLFFDFMGSSGAEERSFRYNLNKGKVQRQFKDDEEFFCDVNGPGARSKEPPTSVHRLTPGDIDIIAAMGDSLTSGNGGMAQHILEVTTENKGISWSIGGQGTWRQFLTIPNILKLFNPNLYGYSLTDGLSYQKTSRFNVAEIGAMISDLPFMAKILKTRMSNDPKVDMKNHWKLITLMIGPNDFCSDICYRKSPEKMLDVYERDLLSTIKIIKENIPRTMLNIVLTPSMDILLEFRGKPNECVSTHHFECPCFFGSRFRSQRKRLLKLIEQWKKRQEEIVLRDEYQNSDDFIVNIQKFTKHLKFPLNKRGLTDFTYLSLDCFHFSQKGYSLATNALWNNMLEPIGNKSLNWKVDFTDFKCPNVERPFLATKKNSLK